MSLYSSSSYEFRRTDFFSVESFDFFLFVTPDESNFMNVGEGSMLFGTLIGDFIDENVY